MGASEFFANVRTKRELILVLSFRFGVGIGWLRVAENWAVLKKAKKSGGRAVGMAALCGPYKGPDHLAPLIDEQTPTFLSLVAEGLPQKAFNSIASFRKHTRHAARTPASMRHAGCECKKCCDSWICPHGPIKSARKKCGGHFLQTCMIGQARRTSTKLE